MAEQLNNESLSIDEHNRDTEAHADIRTLLKTFDGRHEINFNKLSESIVEIRKQLESNDATEVEGFTWGSF